MSRRVRILILYLLIKVVENWLPLNRLIVTLICLFFNILHDDWYKYVWRHVRFADIFLWLHITTCIVWLILKQKYDLWWFSTERTKTSMTKYLTELLNCLLCYLIFLFIFSTIFIQNQHASINLVDSLSSNL